MSAHGSCPGGTMGSPPPTGLGSSVMRRLVVLAAATAVTLIGSTAQACPTGPLRGWRQVDHTTVSATTGNEGVATVRPPHGEARLLFRGAGAIPQQLKDEGWGHVGDPDSTRGYVVDAYQNTRDVPAPNKMFLVTTPTGQSYEYVHKLQPEEPAANANAQVTITPDAHWLVAGALGPHQLPTAPDRPGRPDPRPGRAGPRHVPRPGPPGEHVHHHGLR